MTRNQSWFDVDKEGLAQLLERRGKAFAVLELVSNGWDQQVTRVDINLKPVEGKRARYILTVEDDDPDGFKDLTHAYTLFAPSNKKGDADVRGRFNLGEKLVLAICDWAEVASTTGCVSFDDTGRYMGSKKREFGTLFSAQIRMTKPEFLETCEVVKTLIPPMGVATTFNGEVIPEREPAHEFKIQLPTEISDDEGNLRPTTRRTTVKLYDPEPGETATIYELGIPIVEIGDRYHVDIGQKVPLNLDRDNVRPAYLRQIRTHIANEMHDRLDVESANSTWVKEALGDDRITDDAVKSIVTARFGEKAVVYDPSDQEANNIAASQGYTVIPPRAFNKEEWSHVRRAEVLQPAGRVTPSPTALFNRQQADGTPAKPVPEEKQTPGQKAMAQYARDLSKELLGFEVKVEIANDAMAPAQAWYSSINGLTLNVGRLGNAWFDHPDQQRVDALLIHEFAHHRASNHLDHSFHDECCRLGAILRNAQVRI